MLGVLGSTSPAACPGGRAWVGLQALSAELSASLKESLMPRRQL